MASWFSSFGNIRQMHSTSLPPAGKAVELESKADGEYIKAKVVEPGAVRLVNEGVYQAFSVGISDARVIRDAQAKNGRITGGTFVETSLVDYPANPNTKFMIAKRRGDAESDATELVNTVIVTPSAAPDVAERIAKIAAPDGEKAGLAAAAAAAAASTEDAPSAPAADDGPAADAPVGQMPYTLKRLHDVNCPAYEWDAVKAAYPALTKQDGVALAMGPTALAAVYEMLLGVVTADGGTGSEVWDIYDIWCIYRDLADYIQQANFAAVYGDDMFFAARSELHEAFKTANDRSAPGESADTLEVPPPGPRPADEVQAGSFARPYLTAGHQTQGGFESAPRVPVSTHVPDAADYTRGPLTVGHQQDSPANKAVRAILAVHDHIAKVFPAGCPLQPADAVKLLPGIIAEPPTPETMDMRPTSTPTPTELLRTSTAPGEKAATAETTKVIVNSDMPALIKAAVVEALQARDGQWAEERAALQRQIDELGAQPAEGERAPMRTPVGTKAAGTAARVEKVTAATQALERMADEAASAANEERTRIIDSYKRMSESHDPDMREAGERLLKAAGAMKTEEVITG